MSKLFSERTSGLLGGGLIAVLVLALGYAWWVRAAQRGGDGGARILKLGHGLPTDHPVHEAMVMMAERVGELSDGRLQIQLYPAGMIGSEAECLKQVQNGQLDLSKTSTAVLESSVPEITAIGLPYVFRDSDHFWKVLNGPVGRELAEHLPGMRGLVYYDAGKRSFYTTKKPVRKAEDLKGMKIRTQQSRSAMDMVSAFGGAPTPIPWGELYTALSQGTVDGAENNLPSFETGRHMEVCKYFTFSEHVMVPDLLVISADTWDSLSEQQRKWLETAAAESGVFQRRLWEEAEKRARARSEEQGVEFIPVDKAAFAAKMEPVYASYTGKTADMIRRIREVK